MNLTITPGFLQGRVNAMPSKSHAHRALICATFADRPTKLLCRETNRDMEATAQCLNALGAAITRTPEGYLVVPIQTVPKTAELHCRDSGSTLRFLLPLVGVLGIDALFHMDGRLPQRPLSPLWEEMERMGCILSRPTPTTLRCRGTLHSGCYRIPGNISSQYITGLLLALIHPEGTSSIQISGRLESKPYVDLTLDTLRQFGIQITIDHIPGKQRLISPENLVIEGDWSNAAFFLAANALGNNIDVSGLSRDSSQGDRQILTLLPAFQDTPEISAVDIPDLIPILSVVAAAHRGALFTDIRRLRMKESDRVEAVIQMLHVLGGKAEAAENTLRVYPTGCTGGTVESCNDPRIALSAAIAATACKEPVTILGAECVQKSYPRFWEEFKHLGGNYEQYIR